VSAAVSALHTRRTPAFRLLAHDFTFESDDTVLVEHLAACWSHLPAGDPAKATAYGVHAEGTKYRPFAGSVRGARTERPNHALAWLLWSLNQAVAATAGDGVLLVHGGVVAAGVRGVVVTASAEKGKSTLLTGLARRGLAYGGDEFVAVALDGGGVTALPRPPALEGMARELLAELEPPNADAWFTTQWTVDPGLLAGGVINGPVEPEVLVVPRYWPDAPAVIKPLTRADALTIVLRQSFNLHGLGRIGLHAAADLVRRCRCVELVSGDLEASCDAVLEVLG
jgi:hypothetical protein